MVGLRRNDVEGGGIGRGRLRVRILEFIEACRKGFWGGFGGAACYNYVVGRQSGAARYYRSFQMISNSFRVLVDTDGCGFSSPGPFRQ